MIVVDASVVVELVVYTGIARRVAERIFGRGEELHAPHLLDIEVVHALRRNANVGTLPIERATAALEALRGLPIERHPHEHLTARMWELRHNVSAYDAAYVALAEVLMATLVTRDRGLARSRGHTARIEFID